VTDSPSRDVVLSAYGRLRETLEAKHVRAESLRALALEALDTVKTQAERDPHGIAEELDRLRVTPSR
jgi:hypothetical protein